MRDNPAARKESVVHRSYLRRALVILLFGVASLTLLGRFYRDGDRYRRQDFSRYYSDTIAVDKGVDIYLRSRTTQIAYPPAFYLVFSPLTRFKPQNAHRLWEIIQMSSLIAALLITLCEVRPVIDCELVLYTFAVAFAFPPFQTSIHYGQPTALLLLLLIAAWSRSRRGDDIGAGIFLASAVLLKAFPWVMAGYFVSQRRWRVLVSAAIFSGFCGGAVVAVYGLRCSLDFLTHTRVAAVWLDRPRNLSVLANAHQMIYRLNSIGVVWQQRLTRFLVIAVDLTLILTSFIATSWSNDKTSWSDGMCWSLWVLTTILLAPVAWDHYWVLILPLWPFSSVYLRISSAEGAIARSGLILIACGFLGFFIVPYVQTLKDLHLYFFLTLSSYIGICILLRQQPRNAPRRWWAGATTFPSQPSAIPVSHGEPVATV